MKIEQCDQLIFFFKKEKRMKENDGGG
jgi:hypothetical protein